MKKVLLLSAIMLLPAVAFGQFHGLLTEDTVWGPGEVIVDGNIDASGHILTILPGTTVKIHDNVKIFVAGPSSIIADGTPENKIIFEAFSDKWNHIQLSASTGNIFDNCIFRDGSDWLVWPRTGGGLYANASSLTVTNCTFTGNTAERGAALGLFQCVALISQCEFYNNFAWRGGAIHIQEDDLVGTPAVTVTIDRCKIYSNRSTETGGIHVANNSTAIIQNSLIFSNSSSIDGGITVNGFAASTLGSVDIINCVIANNIPHDLFFRGSARSTALNSIIWGSDQSVGYGYVEPVASNLVNCAVQGAYTTVDIPISTYINSFKLNSSNSATDGPNFISPLNDYNITSISPCRNSGITAGAPSTDFLGNTRTEPYDIGAYEVQRSFIRWIGSASSSWDNADNWSPVGIPGTLDEVGIFSGGIAPEISGAVQCYNLIIEPTASLTLIETGSLSLTGSLVINSSTANNSGSFINKGTLTGNVIYNRALPDDGGTQLWHYVASPVNPSGVISFKQFTPWNEVTGTWGLPASNIVSGIGYAVRGGGSVSFSGSLASSNLTINTTSPYNDILTGTEYSSRTFVQGDGHSGITRSLTNYGGGGFNMLGNPFTSALRVTDANEPTVDFLSHNNASFDPNYVAIYLYDGDSYSYIGNSTGWTVDNPTPLVSGTHVQVGQAFFVLAMNDYAMFNFTADMQDHNPTVALLKSGNADNRWPGLQLKVKNSLKENSTLIVYDRDMTPGLDPGYDVGLISSGSDVKIYSVLAANDNNINFARQALPLEGADTIIVPIGLDTKKGGEMTFYASTVPINTYRYLLEDRVTGVITDIGKKSYTITLPANTYGTGRFYLHTASIYRKKSRPEKKYPNILDLRTWTSDDRLIIQGNVSNQAICEIYDLHGEKVLMTRLTDGELNTVNVDPDLSGVYLVRVVDGPKVYSRRVVFLL